MNGAASVELWIAVDVEDGDLKAWGTPPHGREQVLAFAADDIARRWEKMGDSPDDARAYASRQVRAVRVTVHAEDLLTVAAGLAALLDEPGRGQVASRLRDLQSVQGGG